MNSSLFLIIFERKNFSISLLYIANLFPDWPKANSEFSKSMPVTSSTADYTIIKSRTPKVTSRVIMHIKWHAFCCLSSVKKQKHDSHLFFSVRVKSLKEELAMYSGNRDMKGRLAEDREGSWKSTCGVTGFLRAMSWKRMVETCLFVIGNFENLS